MKKTQSKIEKLLNALEERLAALREVDYAAPGCKEKWQALDELQRDCQRDVRKFGPESLLEPDEEDDEEDFMVDHGDDLGPVGWNPDPHLRGLP